MINVNLNVEVFAKSEEEAIHKFKENYNQLIEIYCLYENFSVNSQSIEINDISSCEEVEFENADSYSKSMLLNLNLEEMSKNMNDFKSIELSLNNFKFIENLYNTQLKICK